jgi:hypothetical protein
MTIGEPVTNKRKTLRLTGSVIKDLLMLVTEASR